MLSNTQRAEVYQAVAHSFVDELSMTFREREKWLRVGGKLENLLHREFSVYGFATCDRISYYAMKLSGTFYSSNEFPEFWSFRYLSENVYGMGLWFQIDDIDSRLELLEKCINLTQNAN